MIAEIAAEQGADQLTLIHKNTFEPGGAKTDEVIPGTLMQDSVGLNYLMVRSMFRRMPGTDTLRAHALLLT